MNENLDRALKKSRYFDEHCVEVTLRRPRGGAYDGLPSFRRMQRIQPSWVWIRLDMRQPGFLEASVCDIDC